MKSKRVTLSELDKVISEVLNDDSEQKSPKPRLDYKNFSNNVLALKRWETKLLNLGLDSKALTNYILAISGWEKKLSTSHPQLFNCIKDDFSSIENNKLSSLYRIIYRCVLLMPKDIYDRYLSMIVLNTKLAGGKIPKELADCILKSWVQHIQQRCDCPQEITLATSLIIEAQTSISSPKNNFVIIAGQPGHPRNPEKRTAMITFAVLRKAFEKTRYTNKGAIVFVLSEMKRIYELDENAFPNYYSDSNSDSPENFGWIQKFNNINNSQLSNVWNVFPSTALATAYKYIKTSGENGGVNTILFDDKELGNQINLILRGTDNAFISNIVSLLPNDMSL